jgi:hypothetical protein
MTDPTRTRRKPIDTYGHLPDNADGAAADAVEAALGGTG